MRHYRIEIESLQATIQQLQEQVDSANTAIAAHDTTICDQRDLIIQLQEQVEQKDSAISNYALEVNKIHAKNEATNKRLQEQNTRLIKRTGKLTGQVDTLLKQSGEYDKAFYVVYRPL